MTSIKFILPEVSDILGVTVDQAYDRQRVLVAAGILKPLPGRGRGSGVLATARNMAWMLTALLIGEIRSDPGRAIRSVGEARPISGPCPRFGTGRVIDVLESLLKNGPPTGYRWPEQVRVVRDVLHVEFVWRDKHGDPSRVFYSKPKQFEMAALRTEAVLTNPALPELSKLLRALAITELTGNGD